MTKNILFTLPTMSLEQSKAPRVLEICKKIDRTKFTPIVSTDHPGRFDAKANDQFKKIEVPVFFIRMVPQRSRLVNSLIEIPFSISTLKKKEIFIQHSSDYSSSWIEPLIAKVGGVRFWIATKANTEFSGINWWIRFLFADKIIVQSPTMGVKLKNRFPYLNDKVVVIPNGVDTQVYHPRQSNKTLKKTFEIPENMFVLGCVAHLYANKNHLKLIDAISKSESKRKIILLLIGSTADEGYVRKLKLKIKNCGLEKQVRILGLRNDIPDLCTIMDGMILTSYGESLSNAVLQGMACGLPIISSNVGGMSDIIHPNMNGWLINLNGEFVKNLTLAIDDWALSSDKRKSFGVKSLQIIRENYTLEKMVNGHIELYESLIDR